MNSGIILLFLQFCSMTDEHIIIYGTGGDSQRPVLKWDGESANLEREIEDVKEDVISINKQIGVLKNRVEDLETRKGYLESSRTPCLDGWIAYGVSCYYLSSTNVNYAGADEYCKSLRAHLVHVDSKDENTFLKTFMQNHSRDGHIIIYGTGGDSQRPVVKWDGESGNLELEIEDVKEDVVSIHKQIGLLKNRVDNLETRKGHLASSRTPCLDGWIAYGGSCYYFGSNNVNYARADQYCKSLRAHLVHVDSHNENIFLKKFMQNHSHSGRHYWIGITDIETENVWMLSGENKSTSFFDWANSHEPSGKRTENCVRFKYDHSYKWEDVACSYLARPACEENWKGE